MDLRGLDDRVRRSGDRDVRWSDDWDENDRNVKGLKDWNVRELMTRMCVSQMTGERGG
jgi:hypothetical protein